MKNHVNNIKKNLTKKCKGSILVFSLIILSFIMVAALGIAATTLLDRKASIATSNSTSALQLADTGIEFFLQQIYQGIEQDQNLDVLAAAINSSSCDEITGEIKVQVGSADDRQEYTLIPETLDEDGRAVPIGNCDYPIAAVSLIKVIGQNKNTARALEIELSDSLERGLLALWSFEDNAKAENFDPNFPGSPKATDGSVYNHVMTLCPADQAAEEFSGCECYDSPENQEDACPDEYLHVPNGQTYPEVGFPHGSVDHPDSSKRAWVDGIVNESVTGASTHSQALHFDRDNFHHLMMSTSTNDCDSGSCYDALDQDNLNFEADDSFSFSVWFKAPERNDNRAILSRMDIGDREYTGYDLHLMTAGNVKFHLVKDWTDNSNAVALRTDEGRLDDGDWHHVVMTYDGSRNESGVTLYVDGSVAATQSGNYDDNATAPKAISGSIKNEDTPFHIGRRYNSGPVFTPVFKGNNYFDGDIDDVRIYNRVLMPFEVAKLCNHAQDSWVNDNNGTCLDPIDVLQSSL